MAKINRGGVGESWLKLTPPGFVKISQPIEHLWVLFHHVLGLPWIFLDLVKFFAVDEPPLAGHHRAGLPFDRILDSLRIRYQHSVRPIFRRYPIQKRFDAGAIKLHSLGRLQFTKVDQRRNDVNIGGDRFHVVATCQLSFGPVEE